jgi:hypothetical protein
MANLSMSGPSSLGVGSNGFSLPDFSSMFSGISDFIGSDTFANLGGLGSLALQGYGLNKSLGLQQGQLDLLRGQENRAATAQNLSTQNSLALALQTTTPGTPEHAQVQAAIANGDFAV